MAGCGDTRRDPRHHGEASYRERTSIVKITYDKGMVTVSFPYDPNKHGQYPVSKGGKTKIAATTSGFAAIPGTTAKVSLNCTVPLDGQ